MYLLPKSTDCRVYIHLINSIIDMFLDLTSNNKISYTCMLEIIDLRKLKFINHMSLHLN